MSSDVTALHDLNVEIREDARDVDFFELHLAEAFTMRRATGVFVNRKEFIDQRVEPMEATAPNVQRVTDIEAVTMLGDERAVVTCTVVLGENRFHNVPIFTKSGLDGGWQVLGWANSKLP
jgi:hypothetical protein